MAGTLSAGATGSAAAGNLAPRQPPAQVGMCACSPAESSRCKFVHDMPWRRGPCQLWILTWCLQCQRNARAHAEAQQH